MKIPLVVAATWICWLQVDKMLVAETPPNIIVMMADDMGMGDTSAYQDVTGNADAAQLRTPNMDRLARMGVRFTDAHAPSSRCTTTRYALLTGRYAWRSRLKHFVLFGVQGDPLIEPDRPTLATLLKRAGYRTGMVGKWHVGLRYRQSSGKPAEGWEDADLTQPMYDTPLDHGFDYCRFTSRSHGTSGPDAGAKPKNRKRRNGPGQSVGPGHVHGRTIVAASGDGKRLTEDGEHAYVLSKLGSRHSDHALDFIRGHVSADATKDKPFFLYYACNSNHSPYTPDTRIGKVAVAKSARSLAGNPLDLRADFIFENDVALGRMIDLLTEMDDPRNPSRKMISNTLIIFTSDNGAERDTNVATGPFRSNKGSVYEGGHRVPFLVSWPQGGIGDGDPTKKGRTSLQLLGLQDLFATFAEMVDLPLPDLRAGKKGAEDSLSMLTAMRGGENQDRVMLFNDHKQAKGDKAAVALRVDNPVPDGTPFPGKWKLILSASLVRRGEAQPLELYDLATDSEEKHDRMSEPSLKPLVRYLVAEALRYRSAAGHRFLAFAGDSRTVFQWAGAAVTPKASTRFESLAAAVRAATASQVTIDSQLGANPVRMTLKAEARDGTSRPRFVLNERGLGISGGASDQVESGEAFLIQFDRDVIVESASIVAGNGTCGGFYRVGDHAPLAIYCVDADRDSQDQSGHLSDVGLLKAGQVLRLDSSRHLRVEPAGQWRLRSLTIREVK